MKINDLKEEHIMGILGIYEEHCGFGRKLENVIYENPSSIIEKLVKLKFLEYRIGSRWDGNSKLYLQIDLDGNLTVGFNSNFDIKDRNGKKYEEAQKAGNNFTECTAKYLDDFITSST